MRGVITQFLYGLLTGLLAAGAILVVTRRPPGHSIQLEPPPTRVPIRVYVTGAVAAAGVYSLPPLSRWEDALAAAGGPTGLADLAGVNLAQTLGDGEHLDVPRRAPTAIPTATRAPTAPAPQASPAPQAEPDSESQAGAGADSDAQAAAAPTPAPAAEANQVSAPAGGLININTAGVAELDSLPGIGPAIAQRIVDYRAANGPFTSVDQIQNVKGIGPATFGKIQAMITVGP